MNMSSRARSWFVLERKKKPIGRAVATNENHYPMKIGLGIKMKMKMKKRTKKEGGSNVCIYAYRISGKQRQVSFF